MKNLNKADFESREVFAQNLLRYLAQSGAKQVDVAKYVGVTPTTFCDWTHARSYPRLEKIQLLADYFGIQKSDLVEAQNIAKETVTDKEQQILDLFHQVPKEKREFVLSLIQAAIDNL